MDVFWVVALCSLVRVMEAASTSEMVNFHQTTQHNYPENSHLHTCCHENLKSHKLRVVFCKRQDGLRAVLMKKGLN
jgi:hypothetical protein